MSIKQIIKILIVIYLFANSVLSVYSQTIDRIEIQGNVKTKTDYLKNLIKLELGQKVDSVLLNRDIQRFIREPGISNAFFTIQELETNSYLIVYNIQENFSVLPQFNFYSTNDNEIAYRLGITEFNFLGRGVQIGGFFQSDIYNSYSIFSRAPLLFSNTTGLAIAFQDLTTEEPVFFENMTANYRYNNTSIEILLLYQKNLNHKFEAGGSLFSEDYEYLNGATASNVPRELQVDKRLLKGNYEFNDVAYFYQYLDGIRNVANIQYVHSTENSLPNFVIWRNDFIYYKRISSKGNWASRLRVGFATNTASPFAPFAVDNNLNIRGVGNLIDRGTGMIVLNTEYRNTIVDQNWFVMQGNIFVDAGSWRNPGGDFGDFSKKQNIRIYPGLGLRFIHKNWANGILRIDYGFGITPDATKGFVFGIGQYF